MWTNKGIGGVSIMYDDDYYYDITERCGKELLEYIRRFYRRNFSHIDEKQFSLFLENVHEQFYDITKGAKLNPVTKQVKLEAFL
jgi:hypothetical protein